MKPRFPKFGDPTLNSLSDQLVLLFSNISRDNFFSAEVSGTTAATANASRKFRHNLGGVPTMVFILEGDAYVSRNGVGAREVDVRSAQTSQEFLALVVR